MANEKSQPLKAFEDIKKRRKDPKIDKAFVKEGIRSKYSSKEPPMKGERVKEGFKARRKAKTKDVLKKFGRSILRSTPTTKIAGVISDLRNREKKADFQKGDYRDIIEEKMAKGGRAGLKGGGICKRGMNRKAVGKNS